MKVVLALQWLASPYKTYEVDLKSKTCWRAAATTFEKYSATVLAANSSNTMGE